MRRVLITGGAGFIGSNLIQYLLDSTEYEIICYDAYTYAASKEYIPVSHRVKSYSGCISDKQELEDIFNRKNITDVINLAAETHVDNSITNPEIFFKTNVIGTQVLADVAYKYWSTQGTLKSSRFHQVSTDEVYGSLAPGEYFTEDSRYAPNSPYSASKAGSDFVIRAYHETFGMNTVITNCSNNFGPHQHIEKLIPKVIHNALKGIKIHVYGNGTNERDWLFVYAHCSGILKAFEDGVSGETYLIGTDNVMDNNSIITSVLNTLTRILPREPRETSYFDLLEYVSDRPGHDKRYAIDSSKIKKLGWSNEYSFEDSIEETVRYYIRKYNGHD